MKSNERKNPKTIRLDENIVSDLKEISETERRTFPNCVNWLLAEAIRIYKVNRSTDPTAVVGLSPGLETPESFIAKQKDKNKD